MKIRILPLILVLSLVLSIGTNGFAINSSYENQNDQVITPEADDVCNGKSYHDMVSKGFGTAYIGTHPDTSNRILGSLLAVFSTSMLFSSYMPRRTSFRYANWYIYNMGCYLPYQ